MSSTRGSRPFLAASVLALVLAGHSPAHTQETEELRPVFSADAVEVEVGGRVHMQFNTTSVDGEQPSEFFLRRVRLETGVRINDLVSAKLAPEFSGQRVAFRDAYVRLDFSPALQVLAGHAFIPFSVVAQTSSNRALPIERGLAIRGLDDDADAYEMVSALDYADRDVGVQVMGRPTGAPLGFGYQAGVFSGPLDGEVGAQDSYQFAARATVSPARNVRLGTAWSSRDFARPLGESVDPELRRGHAFGVDAELGSYAPGFHFVGEVLRGDYDPYADAEFTAAQGWIAYRTPVLGERVAHLEPVLRTSWARVDDAATGRDPGGLLVTPGLNLYFTPLTRLLLNYDVWNPNDDGRETVGSFKAQLQVAF